MIGKQGLINLKRSEAFHRNQKIVKKIKEKELNIENQDDNNIDEVDPNLDCLIINKTDIEKEVFVDSHEKEKDYSLNDLFKDVYLSHSAEMIQSIFDDGYDSIDSSESDDDEINNQAKSMRIPKLGDFNMIRDVNKLVNTLIFNIKESTNRNISHLYNVHTTSSEFSSGNLQIK